ncbi:MAG: class I SAM-dependent methyltransferase [Bdellovibrionales bacterium]|nr:class I SAM-dependent methyltransferase [Bdellovibrionales bacterium]
MKREAEIFHQRPNPIPGKVVPTPVGSMNYNVLAALLEEGGVLKFHAGAEVGIFEGATSSHLLRLFPDLYLYCIDPFVDYSEHEENRTQLAMSKHEQIARERLAPFGERVKILKNFSVEAAKQIPDESLDFVFIDAIHTYQAVSQDLKAWYPKVRPDGLISGHDFSWSGVRQAVEEFLSPLGKSGFHTPSTSDIWFFVK